MNKIVSQTTSGGGGHCFSVADASVKGGVI